jgi:hypothetical protein
VALEAQAEGDPVRLWGYCSRVRRSASAWRVKRSSSPAAPPWQPCVQRRVCTPGPVLPRPSGLLGSVRTALQKKSPQESLRIWSCHRRSVLLATPSASALLDPSAASFVGQAAQALALHSVVGKGTTQKAGCRGSRVRADLRDRGRAHRTSNRDTVQLAGVTTRTCLSRSGSGAAPQRVWARAASRVVSWTCRPHSAAHSPQPGHLHRPA